MPRTRESLKGISLLSAAEVASQGCSFVRNIILAHYLTKADFGVAALLAMVLTLLETTGKMALGQQVVQSPHGDNPAFINAVQFLQLASGAMGAAMILVFAWPAAYYLSAPRYLGAIMALALVPFVNGLGNLDVYRQARRLGFERLVLADTVPQLAVTLAAWPVAAYFSDYRAVLILMLSRAVLASAMTHLLAERRFHPKLERKWVRDSLAFGWPLLLSGFIQFGNFQGESMVVAAGYSLAQLGEFSVANTLAMTPAFAFMRVSQAFGLPVLAEVQGDPAQLVYRYAGFVEITALVATSAVLGLVFLGEFLVVHIFGAKYAGVGILASWLISGQALRVIRGATVSAAMARGDTVNMMLCSAWRLCGLPLSIAVGLRHWSLNWFAVTGFAGETVALWAAIARLASRQHVPARTTLAPAALGLVCVLAALGAKSALGLPVDSPLNALPLVAALAVSAAVFAACFAPFRALVAGTLAGLKLLGRPVPPPALAQPEDRPL